LLSIGWNPDLDGNVVINFFGNNQTRIQLLPFFEPWYLDEKNLVCGPLITNFSQELILNLLAAPKIPIENITSFIQSSAKIFSTMILHFQNNRL
jgi:hypothetical protein